MNNTLCVISDPKDLQLNSHTGFTAQTSNNDTMILSEQKEEKSIEYQSLISHSSSQLQVYAKNIQTNISEIRKSSQLVPLNCQDEKIKLQYTNFLECLNKLQIEFDSVQTIMQKVKLFSQKAFAYFQNISQTLAEQAQIGQPISMELTEDYNNDLKKIKQQYDEFQALYTQKQESVVQIGITQYTNEVSNSLNEITQNYISKEQIEEYILSQTKLLERKQKVLEFDGKIAILQAQIDQTKRRNEEILTAIQEKKQEIAEQESYKQEAIQETQSLKSMSDNMKKDLIKKKGEIISKLMTKKNEISEQSNMDLNQVKDSILQSFEHQQKSLKDLSVEPVSFFKIFMIDESGSMSGTPFDECINAVKETIKLMQNSPNCEDSVCLMQFDTQARVILNKKSTSQVDVNKIPTSMRGGGTDFYSAFQLLKEVLQLCNHNERPQVIFLTDGDSSNKQQYLNTLQEISNQFSSKGISLFCLAYGSPNTNDLKDCLKVINKDSMTLTMKDGSKIQTLYQVTHPQEIVQTFQNISLQAQFNAYQITIKTKAIQDMSNTFTTQLQNQAELSMNSIQLQIDKEYQQLNELQSNDDSVQNAEKLQNIQAAYSKLINAKENEINQLNAQIQANEKNIVVYENEIEGQKQMKITLEAENKSHESADTSGKNLQSALMVNSQTEALIKKFGFSHFSKFSEFNQTLDTVRRKKEELLNFLNQLQQYIEGIQNQIDEIQIKVKRLVNIQKSNSKIENSKLIEIFQRQLNIQNKSVESSEVIKRIIFSVDAGLEQYLTEHNLLDFFVTDILSRLGQKLEYIQTLKVVATSEDDNGPFVKDYVEEIFSEVVEESDELKKSKKDIREIDAEIKTLREQLTQAKKDKDKDAIKDTEDEIKEKTKEKSEKSNEQLNLKKEFKLDNLYQRKCIERSINYLKQAIDSISYQNNKFRVYLPLTHFCSLIVKSSPSIKQTYQLCITSN